MDNNEIFRISKEFTAGFLGHRTSAGHCSSVCSALHAYLAFEEINVSLTCGELEHDNEIYEHWWLTLPDGTIIDPTADQFNALFNTNYERVYFGVKPDHYTAEIMSD